MSDIAIGMGFDERIVKLVLKELCIRADREAPLMEMLEEQITHRNENSQPTDVLQHFIAHTTKANELTFLCFMYGITVGGMSAAHSFVEKLPGIIDKSARIGAAAAMEGNLPPDMAEAASADPTKTPAKKKNPDDIMYG